MAMTDGEEMKHMPERKMPSNGGEEEKFSNFKVDENGFMEKFSDQAFECGTKGEEK